MQQEQFECSPPQSTLTQNKWIATRKVGKDDDEIRQVKLQVESDRKANRKRPKVFVRGSSANFVRAASNITNTEISDITQTVEAEVYESSQDSDFKSKLISPREKQKLHGRINEGGDDTIKTPTRTAKRKSNSANNNSVLNKDLRKHIEAQNKLIAELRRKLEIIRDVASDAKFTDTRQMLQDNIKNTTDTQINILQGSEDDLVLPTSPNSASKNVINLHFN